MALRTPAEYRPHSARPQPALDYRGIHLDPQSQAVSFQGQGIGVQLGGSMKNYIAIAAGMIDGANLGLNIRAALITRGLAEMQRLGVKMGANPHTFSGLSGLGDLVLTCTGNLSRNHTVGMKIGQGMKLRDVLDGMRMVAEGVKTAHSVYHLSQKIGVEMPICEGVYHVLFEDADFANELNILMTRRLKDELE